MPQHFVGGEVLFGQSRISNNVCICDFNSMYPSVITSCGISPECIDYVDHGILSNAQFDSLEVHYVTHMYASDLCYACVLYGINVFDDGTDGVLSTPSNVRLVYAIPIAWHSECMSLYTHIPVHDIMSNKVAQWIKNDVRFMSLSTV